MVPVYNAEGVLNRTIDALRVQTAKSIEFICVDDGSTDGSGDLLSSIAKNDCRFKVIRTNNQGAFRARERGILEASGDYIAFCDAGDEPSENAYEVLLRTAVSNCADMAICAYERVGLGGRTSVEMRGFGDSVKTVASDSGWLVGVNTSVWNKLIRRDAILKCDSLDSPPRIMEDALFLLSVYPYVGRVAFTPLSLYRYNVEEGSAMSHLSEDEVDLLIESWRQARSSVSSSVFSDVVDLAAFVHLGVSARLLLDNPSAVKKIDRALCEDFPLHKDSPFLSLAYIKANPCMKMVGLAHFCHKLGLLSPALTLYKKVFNLARW